MSQPPTEGVPQRRVHSASSVAEIVRNNIEPESAEEVLTVLKRLDGQLISTRLLDKLPGGRVEWRLSRQLGWTEIRNRAYIRSSTSRDGMCLMLARSEGSVPLSADFVERENPAYFRQRRERNALRRKALADTNLLERVARVLNELERINELRRRACAEFAVFVASGEPLSPDQFDLERACGLREDK